MRRPVGRPRAGNYIMATPKGGSLTLGRSGKPETWADVQKLLAAHKAGQLQFFDQHTHLAERKALAACWRRRATSKPTTAPSRSFWRTFGLGFFVYVTNFSRNSDRLGDLPVADLGCAALISAAIPPTAATPVRGPALRPCAAGRARRRGRLPAARPRLSGMSSASIRRRRPPAPSFKTNWRGIPLKGSSPFGSCRTLEVFR